MLVKEKYKREHGAWSVPAWRGLAQISLTTDNPNGMNGRMIKITK